MRKNKLKIFLASILLALTAILFLSACSGGGGGDALKGTWNGKSNDGINFTWIFDGKGGCKTENEYGLKDEGTYTIDGSSVKIKLSAWDAELGYQFKIDGSKLSLTPDESFRPSYELEKK